MVQPKVVSVAEAKAAIVKYVTENPEQTWPQVAQRFGLSVSYINRIAAQAGLPKRKPGYRAGTRGSKVSPEVINGL